ncbi:MAG: NADP-dependent phosphogluconate dehydrogenase, partial [Cyanobacteria bacterium J06627_8]
AFSASLDYFDSYRRASLPQNLTQAQRDYFGAHTFERVDKPGTFHYEWF